MDYSLSDKEIAQYIPNVITYDDLPNYTAEQVMSNLPLVILYRTGENYGHWTLLHRANGHIEFFDSYGYKPDTEFDQMPEAYRLPPYLVQMLYGIGKKEPIHYNQYKFQAFEPGVSTCGRWCILRHLFNKWTVEEFRGGIMKLCDELEVMPDEFTVMAVQPKVDQV